MTTNKAAFPWRDIPWWLVAIIFFLIFMGFVLITDADYNQAFHFILGEIGGGTGGGLTALIGKGLSVTIYTTLIAYIIALFIGLLAGLGRVSENILIRNLAIIYIEFIRGVPTLVLIFTLALVVIPAAAQGLGFNLQTIPDNTRAILALAIIYGAYMAEIFRAGIESISRGQMEAARSLGMTAPQGMIHIILPQAIRNVLPALWNDFIAMLKDSSLVSVLAVRDITQMARLYAGSSFRFQETYLVLTFLYLSMTLILSLILRFIERRTRIGGER
ncbi:MAG: amino acid ABC transporter permease [Candidatus Promineifilaceae bacterium]